MAATTKATKKEATMKVAKTEGAVAKTAPAQPKAKAPTATTPATANVKNAVTAEELREHAAAGNDPKLLGIRLHGKEFVGTVISDKANKTVTVEWERRRLITKFERYEKRYSRVYAHNPSIIHARLGDTVRIQETRPLSKTKNFVVVEVIKRAAETEAAQ